MADAPRRGAPALDLESGWDYAPAPDTTALQIAPRYGVFLDGAFRAARSRRLLETIDPANEEVLSRVAACGPADIDAAVEAARRALPKWQRLRVAERARILYRIALRIEERAAELAALESRDTGKPIREAAADVQEAARYLFHYAGWADKLGYAFAGRRARPVGVCAAIVPWNYPLLLAVWKCAPALACGNTVVLKPAESAPLAVLRLAEILQECGLPPGVVNVLPGDGQTGAALAGHAGVSLVSFTGSTAVGKRLAGELAGSGRRLVLELGGKSPQLVFDDANLDQAVDGIADGIWSHQGQVCSAGSLLLVQENVHDEVLQRLDLRLRTLRIGDPLDRNTDVGPLHSRAQWERVQGYLEAGRADGAELHQGGRGALPERGWWVRPGYFVGVEPAHRIAREEIFGPLLAVISFRTPDEAVALANGGRYGLAAGVWTAKAARAYAVARRLQAGTVWCNSYQRFDPCAPFGGFRESGIGREGGRDGLRPYVELEAWPS